MDDLVVYPPTYPFSHFIWIIRFNAPAHQPTIRVAGWITSLTGFTTFHDFDSFPPPVAALLGVPYKRLGRGCF